MFGVNSVELVSAKIKLGKRVRPKGEAALFDASLTNSARCSCDDPSGFASAFRIGAERCLGFEVEVPLDRQAKTATVCLEDAKPNRAQLRVAKAEIAKTELCRVARYVELGDPTPSHAGP